MIEYPELSNLLDNKNVIVVGRSMYLNDTQEYPNQGEFIDSHDIVVRVNRSHPVKIVDSNKLSYRYKDYSSFSSFIEPSWYSRIGSRVDIQHINRSVHKWAGFITERFVEAGGIVITSIHLRKYEKYKEAVKKIKRYTSYCPLSATFYKKTNYDYRKNFGGTTLENGCMIISELLRCNIKSLRVIGFTCRQLESEYNDKLRCLPNHTLDSEILWLKHQFNTDSRLKTGFVLQSIFDNAK